jgi:hypothetical protein
MIALENALVKVAMPEEKLRVFFMVLRRNFSRDDINLKIAAGLQRRYN